MFYSALFRKVCISLASFSVALSAYSLTPLPVAKTIAITQIVGHESLDKVRQGILDELSAQGYQDRKNAHIIIDNAQGSVVMAAQIAQKYITMHPDVVVAIATPSAQAVANADKKVQIPIVFASISNPVSAKLVPQLAAPGGYMTGTRNVSPLDKQIALIKNFMPHAKTIGVVINYGEANSVELLKTLQSEAKRQGIVIKVAAVTTSAEVKMAVETFIQQIDAMFLLQDNTVASALPALIRVTQQHHVPVFSSYQDAVKAGALAGLAFDEYDIGRQTGAMVVRILHGEHPGSMNVEDPHKIQLLINTQAMKQLQIKISDDVIKSAKLV